MGSYPKEVTVSNIDPELYGPGQVVINLAVIVPEVYAQDILNRIGAIL